MLLSAKRELIIIYEALITGAITLDWREICLLSVSKIILKFKENGFVSD